MLAAVSACAASVGIQQTVVVSMLPDLQREFGTDLGTINWVYTATLLAGGIAGPLLSRLGDMQGRKRMLIVLLVLGTVGSLLCATAHSLGVLIVGRALAGLGAAAVPLGIGIIRDAMPPHRTALGVGIVSACLGLGGGLGFLLAGLVDESGGGFRAAFAVCSALAALAAAIGIRLVQDRSVPTGGSPGRLGALFFSASVVALLVALNRGSHWGWGSERVRYLLMVAAVLLLLSLRIERVVKNPLVDLRLMADPRTLASSTTGFLLGVVLFATFTLVSTLGQIPEAAGYGFGASIIEVGLYLTPNTGGLLVFGILAGPVVARCGAALATAFGSGLMLFRLVGATVATAAIGAVLTSRRDPITGCRSSTVSSSASSPAESVRPS